MFARSGALAAGVSLAVLSATAAQAQAVYQFNLPAQPLETSLRAVASQTTTNVVFSNDLVRGKSAPALQGSHSPQAAYQALLVGSGLRLGVTDGGSFVVSGPAAAATPGAARAQAQGALIGRVSAGQGVRGLDGALVRLVETGQTTRVDEFGSFRFASVPAGANTIEISFLGYQTLIETVTVPAGLHAQRELGLGRGRRRLRIPQCAGQRAEPATHGRKQRRRDLGRRTGQLYRHHLLRSLAARAWRVFPAQFRDG
jgi:hypothetical protein